MEPNTLIDVITVHDDIPTHASRTEREFGASHALVANAPHVPVGSPKEAKSMA